MDLDLSLPTCDHGLMQLPSQLWSPHPPVAARFPITGEAASSHYREDAAFDREQVSLKKTRDGIIFACPRPLHSKPETPIFALPSLVSDQWLGARCRSGLRQCCVRRQW